MKPWPAEYRRWWLSCLWPRFKQLVDRRRRWYWTEIECSDGTTQQLRGTYAEVRDGLRRWIEAKS